MSWVWLNSAVVIAVHEAQLSEHGGGTGVRDQNLLASALSRPQKEQLYVCLPLLRIFITN